MRLETFSYLPAFTAGDVALQVRSIVERRLVVAIEHTQRPDPYDHYWTLWKLPLLGLAEPEDVMAEVDACRAAHPSSYVRVNGYDARSQGQVASFVVHRPGGAA